MTLHDFCQVPGTTGAEGRCGKPARNGVCSDHSVMLAAERMCEELQAFGIHAHPEWRDGRYTARLVIQNPSKLIQVIGGPNGNAHEQP